MRRRSSHKQRFLSGAASRAGAPFLAVLLLPFLAAAWAAAWTVLRRVSLPWSVLGPALGGAAAYLLLQALFSKPLGLYVFGHELTHALAAWMSGYRVKSLKVTPGGGEVVTSDTNVFVALAPYCVPLYTIIVVLLYALVRRHAALAVPPLWCAFGVGFTFAFHAALTVHALRQRQPDLEHAGVFLSLVLILLANCVALVLLMKFLYPGAVSLAVFGRQWWGLSFDWSFAAVHWLKARFA